MQYTLLTLRCVHQVIDVSKLLSWSQLYPNLHEMAQQSIDEIEQRCYKHPEHQETVLGLTAEACKVLLLLLGERPLHLFALLLPPYQVALQEV